MVLGGSKAGEKLLRAFADVREGADVRGGDDEALGQDLWIDQHGRTSGAEFINGMQEGSACFRFQRSARLLDRLCELLRCRVGAHSLKGRGFSVENESRCREALAFQRAGFQISRVGSR